MQTGFWWKARNKENIIKMNLMDGGLGGMEWIHQAYGGSQLRALVNTIVNILFP
jgi:hypothetical protein